MSNHLTEHKQKELKRISSAADSAREVFQHAAGETFLRFERNVDAELARQIVDGLDNRAQAAQWMAGMFVNDGTVTPYEIYLNEGRDSVLRLLSSGSLDQPSHSTAETGSKNS